MYYIVFNADVDNRVAIPKGTADWVPELFRCSRALFDNLTLNFLRTARHTQDITNDLNALHRHDDMLRG